MTGLNNNETALALKAVLQMQANEQVDGVELKDTYKGLLVIVGVFTDENGEYDHESKVVKGFEDLQSNYVTVQVAKQEGRTLKVLKKNIFENSVTPEVYDEICDAAEAATKVDGFVNENDFIKFENPLTDFEGRIGQMITPKKFYIKRKNGSWAKDKNGRKVITDTTPYILLTDVETPQTEVRRRLRQLEADDAWVTEAVSSEAADAAPVPDSRQSRRDRKTGTDD